MADPEAIERAWAYARDYYRDGDVEASFRLLAQYRPDVFVGYMTIRQGAFGLDPEGAAGPAAGASDGAATTAAAQEPELPAKIKELLILGIEISALMSPPPTYHARKAIEAGATVAEVAEVVALCVMLRGMISYQQSGRYVLEEADAVARELGGAGASQLS